MPNRRYLPAPLGVPAYSRSMDRTTCKPSQSLTNHSATVSWPAQQQSSTPNIPLEQRTARSGPWANSTAQATPAYHLSVMDSDGFLDPGTGKADQNILIQFQQPTSTAQDTGLTETLKLLSQQMTQQMMML